MQQLKLHVQQVHVCKSDIVSRSVTRLKWLQGLSEYVKNFHVESQQSTVHVYLYMYKLNTCNV